MTHCEGSFFGASCRIRCRNHWGDGDLMTNIETPRASRRIRDPQNFTAGLGLLGFVAIGWWASSNLAFGTLSSIGPGMLPRVVLVLIALVGVALLAGSFT